MKCPPPICLIFALFFWTGSAIAAAQPQWVLLFEKGSLVYEDTYVGVGWAEYKDGQPDYECRNLSKDRALDDLSYQLSVSITSKLEEKLSQKGNYSKEQVSSSLFVSTRKVLSGIKVGEKWIDPQTRRYWVLLSIDKANAESQVKEQDFVNEVVTRLEKNQKAIAEGIEKLNKLYSAQAERLNHSMQNMQNMLASINKKLDTSAASSKAEYQPFLQKMEKYEDQWQRREQTSRDQSARLDLLMRQNQDLTQKLSQILKTVQKDHFLALVEDDVTRQQANRQFTVSIVPQKGQNAVYKEGDTIRFLVTANRACYIKVIYSSSLGSGGDDETRMNVLLFPNPHDLDNRIRANTATLIGRKNELVVEPPYGRDIITVMAQATQFDDIDAWLKTQTGEFYTYKTDSGSSSVNSRGIGVRRQAVSDTCLVVTRAK